MSPGQRPALRNWHRRRELSDLRCKTFRFLDTSHWVLQACCFRTLNFILSEIRSHQRVMSRVWCGLTQWTKCGLMNKGSFWLLHDIQTLLWKREKHVNSLSGYCKCAGERGLDSRYIWKRVFRIFWKRRWNQWKRRVSRWPQDLSLWELPFTERGALISGTGWGWVCGFGWKNQELVTMLRELSFFMTKSSST